MSYKNSTDLYRNQKCNYCHKTSIDDICFKCQICPNYILCKSCSTINFSHPFSVNHSLTMIISLKKKSVKRFEDIMSQTGIPRSLPCHPSEHMKTAFPTNKILTGTVQYYSLEKAFGFIKSYTNPTAIKIFFHHSNIFDSNTDEHGIKYLVEGQKVIFEAVITDAGNRKAVDIILVTEKTLTKTSKAADKKRSLAPKKKQVVKPKVQPPTKKVKKHQIKPSKRNTVTLMINPKKYSKRRFFQRKRNNEKSRSRKAHIIKYMVKGTARRNDLDDKKYNKKNRSAKKQALFLFQKRHKNLHV